MSALAALPAATSAALAPSISKPAARAFKV